MNDEGSCFNFNKFESNMNSSLKKVRSNALDELIVSYNLQKVLIIEERILNCIIRCLHDKAEICREKSINFLLSYIQKSIALPKDVPINILLTVKSRLIDGEFKETSEELRCLLVQLIHALISFHYEILCSIYVSDVLNALATCVQDPYPELRKMSCEILITFVDKFDNPHLLSSNLWDQMVESIVPSVKHKHYQVRISAIQCLKCIVPLCQKNDTIELVCAELAQNFPDSHFRVRIALCSAVAHWLLTLSGKDFHFIRLLPFILCLLDDENDECRQEAFSLWEKVGLKYLDDRRDDEKISRKAEFLSKQDKLHQSWRLAFPLLNFDCSFLVREKMAKFLPALMTELTDWKPQVRINSSKLLKMTVLHAQADITYLLHDLLPIMLKVCSDEQEHIVKKNVIETVEMIGCFVPLEASWKIFSLFMHNDCLVHHLIILSSLLKYSDKEQIAEETVNDVTTIFIETGFDNMYRNAEDDSENNVYCNYMMEILSKLVISGKHEDEVVYKIYLIILHIIAAQKKKNDSKPLDLLETLTMNSNNPQDKTDMNRCFFPKLFNSFLDNCPLWISHSSDFLLFLKLMQRFSDDVLNFVPDAFHRITKSILESATSQNKEVAFLLLLNIAESIENGQIIVNKHTDVMEKFLFDSLSKLLVWKSGKTAEILRSAALSIFDLYAHQTKTQSVSILYQHLPILISLCEDNYVPTRMSALRCLSCFMKYSPENEDLRSVLINVLSRMFNAIGVCLNDENNDVRLTAISTLKNVLLNPVVSKTQQKDQEYSKVLELLFVLVEDENFLVRTASLELLHELIIIQQIKKIFPLEKINGFLNNYVDKNLTTLLQNSFFLTI